MRTCTGKFHRKSALATLRPQQFAYFVKCITVASSTLIVPLLVPHAPITDHAPMVDFLNLSKISGYLMYNRGNNLEIRRIIYSAIV
jgi:hypothetical protein